MLSLDNLSVYNYTDLRAYNYLNSVGREVKEEETNLAGSLFVRKDEKGEIVDYGTI